MSEATGSSDTMRRVFEAAKRAGLNPRWVTITVCARCDLEECECES